MEKKNHSLKIHKSYTSSSILIVDSYLQLLSSSPILELPFPPTWSRIPPSETTFLIPSDRSPIDKSRRVIGETSKEISCIVTFFGILFLFYDHIDVSTSLRGTPSLPVPSVFHAGHTRPMISKLFDRKPPISEETILPFHLNLKKNFMDGNIFSNELENLTFFF